MTETSWFRRFWRRKRMGCGMDPGRENDPCNAETPATSSDTAWSERLFPKDLRKREIGYLRARRQPEANHGEFGVTDEDPQLPAGTVGLALSGGGIRSATFCLGVLQSLARNKLIGKIDYLSTVSGGGYIGSFFGALFTREWKQGEQNKVERVESILADSRSEPLNWLRDNGRYLAPNGAGDAWLAAAIIVRNLIAVHTLMVFFVLSGFLFAHSVRAIIANRAQDIPVVTGTALGWPTFTDYGALIFWWSPWVLLPLIVIVLWLGPMCWAYWLTLVDEKGDYSKWTWAASIAAIAGACWAAWRLLTRPDGLESARQAEQLSWGLSVVAIIGVIATTAFAVTYFVGTKTQGTPAEKMWIRNRVSRCLSGGLMITVGLAVFALVDSLGQTVYALVKERGGLVEFFTSFKTLPPLLAFVASLLAFSDQIVKRLDLISKGKRWRLPLKLVAGVAAVVVAGVLLLVVSSVSYWVAWAGGHPLGGVSLSEPSKSVVPPYSAGLSANHCLVGFAVCAILTLLLSRPEYFLNLSSHVTLYSARIARAYLGASNAARMFDPKNRRLTDVHEGDAITMEGYRPFRYGGPLHLINLTLNETISGSSQIEHRDRKGMSVAVGPAGMSVGSEHHGLWRYGSCGRGVDTGGISPIVRDGDLYHPLAASNSHRNGLKSEPHAIQSRRLEQWIAASGAAFTTGLGWRTSLGASMLMAIGNVRLGHWWDSHITCNSRMLRLKGIDIAQRCREGSPMPPVPPPRLVRLLTWALPTHSYFTQEMTARFFGPQKRYWYLSDGGHFENTGCYELIRRRIPLIICCDCGADPDYGFADLANLVRKARIDFGAEVVFHDERVCEKMLKEIKGRSSKYLGLLEDLKKAAEGSKNDGTPRTHAAIGCVYYPQLDDDGKLRPPRPAEDDPGSTLIVLKPTVTGDEPTDVQRYKAANSDFPQETTGDQFFDEAQWESYRRLGLHIADKVLTETLLG